MTYLSVSSLLIPDYETLSEEKRSTFETSLSGKKLIQFLRSYHEASQEFETLKQSWFGFMTMSEEDNLEFKAQWELQKNELIDEINETEEYKTVMMHMTHQVLTKEIEDFKLLKKEQQELLARAAFSQKLLTTLSSLDQLMEKEKSELTQQGFWLFQFNHDDSFTALRCRRQEAISLWKTQFQEHLYMDSMRRTIDENKEVLRKEEMARKLASLQEHATQLSAFFPLLNYRKIITEKPVIDKLRAQYLSENGEVILESDKMEEEQLTDLLFHCMQQVSKIEIDFVDLDPFNKLQANQLAVAVLNAFNDKSEFDLDDWFKAYEKQLLVYLTKELQLINGKDWDMNDNGVKVELFNSLSYLWNNHAVNKANEFMCKMADAHGFIQATSFSTQNESSFLAILDMYNYARHHEQISETRSILASLLSPLIPLYNEYKDIAFYEKNLYWKSFRIIMPLVVVTVFIILVSLILAPLALPELASTAAFIPAFLTGLALANRYVTVKNELYKSLREKYYGGAFEIPEFQVNARMLHAFGNQENANKVRTFYIEALQHCDAIEIGFISKHEQGILSQEDIERRKENITKLHHLSLEWYDIHSNIDLSYQQASSIFLKQLQQTTNQEFQKLQKTVQEELDSIRQSVTEVATDLKNTIDKNNKIPVVETDKDIESTTIKTQYRYGLFKPLRCLNTRAHIEELVNFQEHISRAASSACA